MIETSRKMVMLDTTRSRDKDAVGMHAIAAAMLIGAALLVGGFGAAYAQDGPIPFLRAFPDGNAVDGRRDSP